MTTAYFIQPQPPSCETCGRDFERTRIGISAVGWAFSFDEWPAKHLFSKDEWLAYLADKVIEDEYGKVHALADFAALVESKEGHRRS